MIASCALRDTFLGHPVSVCPGTLEILTHRVQACESHRRPSRGAKPATTKTPGRAHVVKQSPPAMASPRLSMTASCALRDTFFGHPVSVYPGASEILTHRVQDGESHRRPSRGAKPATTKTPGRAHVVKQSPPAMASPRLSTIASCALRDTFFGHPVSVYPGASEILAHRAQVHGNRRRPSPHALPGETCDDKNPS